jgi:predicted metal-dependent phosphoesterase TrpH
MGIDLHTHSSVSDGTESPAELMATARAAGLDVVALTDHDTTAGWARAEAGRPPGLTVVPGMEMSCRWFPADDGRPVSIHLLAYLFDPAHPGFAAERLRLRDERRSRAERMVAALAADGHPLSWPEILAARNGGVVGRPHIARALVDAGSVESVDHAFATLLHPTSPYYVPKADTDVLTGISLVRTAGGVPVFAHGLASKRGRVVGDDAIVAMAGAGLLGLEVDHPDHRADERAHLRGVAADLGLIVTGSSDYHGRNKATSIGAEVTARDQFELLLAAGTGTAPYRD